VKRVGPENHEVKLFQGVPYRVFYRTVRYPRLEFTTGILHVILPPGIDAREILQKKRRWIREKYDIIRRSQQEAQNLPLVKRTYADFRALVQRFVREAEGVLGVHVSKIQIRKMRTKWGSCSKRGTVTINKKAMYLPQGLLRYLVFHEVNHLKHWRHDREFWKSLARVNVDPKSQEERLTMYWFRLSSLDGS